MFLYLYWFTLKLILGHQNCTIIFRADFFLSIVLNLLCFIFGINSLLLYSYRSSCRSFSLLKEIASSFLLPYYTFITGKEQQLLLSQMLKEQLLVFCGAIEKRRHVQNKYKSKEVKCNSFCCYKVGRAKPYCYHSLGKR